MNKKPYILPSVSVIKIATGNMLQGASGEAKFSLSNDEKNDGFSDARGSFIFEEENEE